MQTACLLISGSQVRALVRPPNNPTRSRSNTSGAFQRPNLREQTLENAIWAHIWAQVETLGEGLLDNLNTHKKNEHWLKAHPNVQFHFTPTSASWLNQVEVWFSILQRQSLSGTSFTSLKQLQEHIDAYVSAYNDKAEPFVWTKKKVRQRRFKGRSITQL
jgi:DDE superfamily endonuclease